MNKLGILNPDQAIAFLRRSYKAVDGLWFMMTEKAGDFERALQIDRRVWEVLPRIQVKKIKDLTGVTGESPEDFAPVLATKFAIEEYQYREAACGPNELKIVVERCPWVDLLCKSGRLDYAEAIADAVCTVDLGGWAQAFHPSLQFAWEERQCREGQCSFRFFKS